MTITPGTSPATKASFANPITTASFSPPAGSTLIACVVDTDYSGNIFTLSNSGIPLDWVEQDRWSNVAIYTAYNATSQSSITVSFATNGSPSDALVLKVWVWDGVDSTDPVAQSNSGSSSTNFIEPWLYTSSVANSRGVYIANDQNGLGSPASGGTDVTNNWTFGSGSGASSSGIAAYKASNSPASTAVYAYLDAFGSGSPAWRWVAVELRPSTTQTIILTGISSGEVLGTPKINLTVSPTGIASGEAFGEPSLALQNLIILESIESVESVGTPRLVYTQFVTPSGIVSAESFGNPTLQLGYPQTVILEGIPSGESVGQGLTIRFRHRIVFRPPSVQEQPAARDRLLIRFGIHRGISVIRRMDDSFYETRYPDQVTVEESQRVYWGGHVNEISVDEYFALIDAGYGSYLSVEELT